MINFIELNNLLNKAKRILIVLSLLIISQTFILVTAILLFILFIVKGNLLVFLLFLSTIFLIISVNIYVKHKLIELRNFINNRITPKIEKVENQFLWLKYEHIIEDYNNFIKKIP